MMKVSNGKTIRRLGWRSMKAARTRNLIAVLAIALTTVLFTSLFTIAMSINDGIQQNNFRQVGGFSHGGFKYLTEEQFNELYEFVKKVRFDRMGAFTYSQEEDTPAADFPNQVDEEIKEERLDRLMTLQQGISLELNKAKLGKTLEVLVEGYDEESFLFYGRSRGDSIDVDGKVYFATEEEVTPGDIIKVKILDADEYDLTGQAEVI